MALEVAEFRSSAESRVLPATLCAEAASVRVGIYPALDVSGVEHSPRFELNFSEIEITQSLMDEVCRFTVRSSRERVLLTDSGGHLPRNIPQGLQFQSYKLNEDGLRILQSCMDQISVNPERRFSINSLSLLSLTFQERELAVAADIIAKNHVYQLRAFTVKSSGIPAAHDVEAEASLQRLIAATFDQAALPTSSLQSISLTSNLLSRNHVASVCSAFQYRCSAVSVAFTEFQDGYPDEDPDQSWRWLAFALFHRRSDPFAGGGFKLRKINLVGWNLYETASSLPTDSLELG